MKETSLEAARYFLASFGRSRGPRGGLRGADGTVFRSTVDSFGALHLLLRCMHPVLCKCKHACVCSVRRYYLYVRAASMALAQPSMDSLLTGKAATQRLLQINTMIQ